jgi:cytidylate kinase
MVVAIDGPAGAGKSTVARALARELGFSYLDSGAMYRAVALSLADRPGAAAERARDVTIELGERVRLDGNDVTEAIRTRQVSEGASRIASDPGVRAALVAKQREMLESGDWVGEGRDIGTVVAPSAELKIYLTASPEARGTWAAPTGTSSCAIRRCATGRTRSASTRRCGRRPMRSSSTRRTGRSRTW